MTIYKSQDNNLRRTLREVVGDSARWLEIWNSLTDRRNPASPIPQVDFKGSVLLVAVGPTLGAGDSVIVRQVLRTGKIMKVSVVSYKQCMPLDVLTVPVHVVQIRRAAVPPHFQEELVIGQNCLGGPSKDDSRQTPNE